MSELRAVSGKVTELTPVEDLDPTVKRGHRLFRAAKIAGALFGRSLVVAAAVTPFAIFTGYKVVDHFRETTADPLMNTLDSSSLNIKGGLDQNGEKLDGLGHTIESGVPVVISGPGTTQPPETEQGQETTTTVTTTP